MIKNSPQPTFSSGLGLILSWDFALRQIPGKYL